MGVLQELVNHREYDALAMYLGKRLNEVHRYIEPDVGGNRQQPEEAGGVQCLGLVLLASGARADIVADGAPIMLDEEHGA